MIKAIKTITLLGIACALVFILAGQADANNLMPRQHLVCATMAVIGTLCFLISCLMGYMSIKLVIWSEKL